MDQKHEQNIINGLLSELNNIRVENNATKIVEVTISRGKLCGINKQKLKHWLKALATDEGIKDCSFSIEDKNPTVVCPICSAQTSPPYPLLKCMKCNHQNVELISGHNLGIEQMAFY